MIVYALCLKGIKTFDQGWKIIERMAVNAPIQGTAADFIKLAMVRVHEALEEKGLKNKAFPLLQIHDELLFEIKEESIKEAIPLIIEAMEGVYKNEVPIKVNATVGKNWKDIYFWSLKKD